MARIGLALAILVFGVLGLFGLVAPAALVAPVGVTATEPSGWSDVRAMYGGLEIAIAAVLATCLREPERVDEGARLGGALIAGIGLGRLVGVALDGPAPLSLALVGVELGAASLLFWAAGRGR